MQPGIPRRCDDRRTQYALSLAIATELAIKIGEVDRGRRILRTKPKCGVVLGLRITNEAAACIEISKRRPCFWPIRIEALGGDELGCCALERFAIGGRLACGGERDEQRGGANAHAEIGIGE